MTRLATALALTLTALAGCSKPDGRRPKSRPATSAPAPAPAGWRGDGTGRYPHAAPPVKWGLDNRTHILWKTKVGGGFSSPVVAGGRIVLAAEPDALLCVRRADGKVLWRKTVPLHLKLDADGEHSDCGFATPTPVTDGARVFAVFGTGDVVCFDLDGRPLWARHLDQPCMTEHGRSASPVLAGGKLLVSVGQLTALDPAGGKVLWHAPKAKPGYGTPAVTTIGGTPVAVTPAGDVVGVADGRVLAAAVAETQYASPLVHDGVVYFVGEPTIAVKLPERLAEPLKPATLWLCDETEGDFYASPVVHDGLLYCASNEGALFALDTGDGKVVWRKQLEIPSGAGIGGQLANIYASVALAGGRLLVGNDAGAMLVLTPGRRYTQLAENYLDEGSGACPAFAGNHLYLRDGEHLYCIGAK